MDYFKNDLILRDKIIFDNINLVFAYVNQICDFKNNEYDDFISIGLIGLIEGIDSYKLNLKCEFSEYLMDSIRYKIETYITKNNNDYTSNLYNSSCFNDLVEDKDANFVYRYDMKILFIEIVKIIKELNDLERRTLLLYYGFMDNKCYTQTEISKKLNLAQSYVSRLIKNSLIKIRKKLIKNDFIDDNYFNSMHSHSKIKKLC